MVENLGLSRLSSRKQVVVQNVQNVLANLSQLRFDLVSVTLDLFHVSGISLGFLLLFNGGDDAPAGTTASNDILVSDRKEVAFFDGEFSSNLFMGEDMGQGRMMCVVRKQVGEWCT